MELPSVESAVAALSEGPHRPVWAEVDLDGISHNVKCIREHLSPGTGLMVVVKANGYGHGAVPVAKAALYSGAQWLGVAIVEEGINLRQAGIKAPILILGVPPKWQAALVVEHGLRVAVCTWDFAQALAEAARRQNTTAKVHVKLDTGMGRLGILPEDAVGFVRRLQTLPNLEIEGIFSHFATADEPDKSYARKQFSVFLRVLDQLEKAGIFIPIRHMANTAAALTLPETQLSLVRSGIAVYGLAAATEQPRSLNLHPCMELKAAVSYVHRVPAGSGISYGKKFVTSKATNIVTLPVGYADGYSRLFSGKGEVLLRGQRYPIVGAICMDQCMVDVGDLPVEIGEEAVLLGRQGDEEITADELAEKMGTINYEIICMIGSRVPRIYKGEEAKRQGFTVDSADSFEK
ncbi:MAG: alanine racemase [Firmicutes bacterium]|nr:alanine racemase [Bacillota bacterium]